MRSECGTYMKWLKNNALYIVSMFIFSIFLFISYQSPLAGDDWGYALNGLRYNPFLHAIDFYFTWSGRFFSELYGFLVAPNRWFWVLLNPLLFTSIFILMVKLTHKKTSLLSLLLITFLMLSIKDELRMETYTWLMGTTYVIPLMLSLYVLYHLKLYLFDQRNLSKLQLFLMFISIIITTLMMENISVVLVFTLMVSVVYHYFTHREFDKKLLVMLGVSIVGLLILRLSPGAAFRLERDHVEWLQLSLFEQFIQNYPNFIKYSFIEHKYLILTFSSLLMGLHIKSLLRFNQKKWFDTLAILLYSLAILSVLALTLLNRFNLSFFEIFINETSLFSLLYWPLYAVLSYITLSTFLSKDKRLLAISLLTLAGLSNGVMLLSPIFSYRSSLYLVYLLIALSALLIQEFENKLTSPIIGLFLVLLISKQSITYMIKYNEVANAHQIRLSQIQYYVDNPSVTEAWLIRYPVYSIHSGDIEEWDNYHMEVFKDYYGINRDVKLYFYYP